MSVLAFVTVGSTRFDELVEVALSGDVIVALKRMGYTHVVVQCGNSDVGVFNLALKKDDKCRFHRHGVAVEVWRFRHSLHAVYSAAQLVISHAGSGTILEVLRMGKPLIVVPNPTLMDNHQEELAVALSKLGHVKSTNVENLADTIAEFDKSQIVPFPDFDSSKFQQLVDEEMGFL